MNTSSALFADFTIRYFGILPPNQTTVSYPLIRTIAMAIIGAVPMALIYERTGSNYDIAVRVFLLSFALIAFLLWFLRLTSCSWTIEGTFLALLLGIAAGTCASIVFCLVEPKAGLVLTWVETKILRVSGTTANFGFVDFLQEHRRFESTQGPSDGSGCQFYCALFPAPRGEKDQKYGAVVLFTDRNGIFCFFLWRIGMAGGEPKRINGSRILG